MDRRGLSPAPGMERAALAAVALFGAAGLWVGWKLFWFLTDGAYIAFRYVSNSRLGFGYVWNAPPFLPVEGYTSFLWVVLLDAVWRVTGVEPPASANWLSLLFSAGTLLVAGAWLWKLPLAPRLARWRVALVLLLVLDLLSNRTFLAWTSSGLETAMFDFLLLAWLFVLVSPRGALSQAAWGALLTVALSLARPDGLLFLAAFVAAMTFRARAQADRAAARRILLLAALALAAVAAHEAWRLAFYGEWLPNTYDAKVVGAWPDSGWRYALSFILEYALWLPGLVLLRALVASPRAGGNSKMPAVDAERGALAVRAIALGNVALHLAFYTLVVGGDHFEYRVYAYLVPLVFLALVWAANRWIDEPRTVLLLLALSLALSWPLPWTHWYLTRQLETRTETHFLKMPVAPYWPRVARGYAAAFDTLQAWLIDRHVGMRYEEHRRLWLGLIRRLPDRAEGSRVGPEGFPIVAVDAVGVVGWIAPRVNVLDLFGLNDFVIARTPIPPGSPRWMAHSRVAPPGYVASFRPNVTVRDGQLVVAPRQPPMTAEDIRDLEAFWRARLGKGGEGAVSR